MSDDLISRQAAIELLINNSYLIQKDMTLYRIIQAVELLPIVYPKTGQWIMHIDDLFPCESTQECSVCHAEQLINGNDDNFCPNCGAKMESEEIT